MTRRQEIIDKIRGCEERALGSDNKHEADLSAVRARELRAKYDVTDAEMDGNVVGTDVIDSRDPAVIITWVGAAAVTGCAVVTRGDGVVVVGLRSSLSAASVVSDHLIANMGMVFDQANQLGTRAAILRDQVCTSPLIRDDFMLGSAVGVTRRLVRVWGKVVVPDRILREVNRHVVPDANDGDDGKIEMSRSSSTKFGVVAGRMLIVLPTRSRPNAVLGNGAS